MDPARCRNWDHAEHVVADGAFYQPHGARQRVLDGVRQERWKPFAVAEGCGAQDGPSCSRTSSMSPMWREARVGRADEAASAHATETVIERPLFGARRDGPDGGEHTPNRALRYRRVSLHPPAGPGDATRQRMGVALPPSAYVSGDEIGQRPHNGHFGSGGRVGDRRFRATERSMGFVQVTHPLGLALFKRGRIYAGR